MVAAPQPAAATPHLPFTGMVVVPLLQVAISIPMWRHPSLSQQFQRGQMKILVEFLPV
jgi:hypothetical protein